jgi:hypothetical protein
MFNKKCLRVWWLAGLLLAGLILVAGCSLQKNYGQSTAFGQKHIELLFNAEPEISYADYADAVKKEYSLPDHRAFTGKVKTLGKYLGLKVDDWQFNQKDGVEDYQIDYALRYPDFTQYVRIVCVKASDKFQMIGIRFITEGNYKKLKAAEAEKKENK